MFALGEIYLSGCTDGQLAGLVKKGNAEAFAELTSRYMSLVRAKAAPLHSSHLEADDLCQEGLVGLLNAARTFSEENRASFRTYAGVCISNRIIMAYRTAANRKNSPLSNSVSLNENESGEEPLVSQNDPESLVVDSESEKLMWDRIRSELSELELRVFRLYLGGYSYSDISRKLSIPSKAADNALQRARVKLKNRIHG